MRGRETEIVEVREHSGVPLLARALGRLSAATPAGAVTTSAPARLFGDRADVRGPALLMIVFGFFLVLVGVTAVMVAATASSRLSAELLNASVSSDAATVRGFANAHLVPSDLAGGQLGPERLARLESLLGTLVERGGILRAEIRRTDGTILVSDRPGLAGSATSPSVAFRSAIDKTMISASIVPTTQPSEAGGGELGSTPVIRAYLPIIGDGKVQAVVGIWRDAQPLLDKVESSRNELLQIVVGAAIISGFVLFLIFRAAQRRIRRQTERLIEAEHRDALTGSPNHGAIVGLLAGALEQARVNASTVSIAIVDIDNFRLLNETHGHELGNAALVKVAELLRTGLSDCGTFGRYGPDEFLLVEATDGESKLAGAVQHVRRQLEMIWLAPEGEERLPVTISAAVSTFPDHGQSLTALLSTAAKTLEEAKAGGGDAVRTSGKRDEDAADTSTFDVLQGLVFAIDAKDRYTKRHSEEVGRYGAMLAQMLGLEPELVDAVRRAGLLHDVGKIGIPDAILRKPSRLTAAEYEVVKQHVALGHLLVRDSKTSDHVRLGVRHHHERWDGKGYLDRLAGEDIPLVARILGVADAFSAMTSTRPYRKALSFRDAIRRLEDAAGSQLDASMVKVFVSQVEAVEEAWLAGGRVGAKLWTQPSNQSRVA
jgi:diguanylate cyclase (GGDEF)-like protein/putative nucleotidyltransferase with HDIG domain